MVGRDAVRPKALTRTGDIVLEVSVYPYDTYGLSDSGMKGYSLRYEHYTL
jgi:hypothetical protein